MVVMTLLVTTLVAYEVNNFYSPTASTSLANEMLEGTSSAGSNGLQLSASLNASQLSPGQNLQVNVSVFNTLSTASNVTVSEGWPFTVNNLTAPDIWPFQGIPLELWPSCFETTINTNASALAQAVVLKGYYTIANISSVADHHFAILPCTEGMWVDDIVFQPGSSEANYTGDNLFLSGAYGHNNTIGTYYVGNTFTTNGYWDVRNITNISDQGNIFLAYGGQRTPSSPTATPFTPGVYTVGVEDVWGQAVILHFEVK